MRVSMHCGVGYAKHNDHKMTQKDDGHIDHKLTEKNRTWTVVDEPDFDHFYSAEEGENLFYNSFFGETLRNQNEKYTKKGQYARVRNMDDWMKASQHRASEVIMQIGDVSDDIDPDDLWDCVTEFFDWKQEKYHDNYQLISLVEHVDEPNHGAHIHAREIWFSQDENGVNQPGIKKALRAAGVPLPDPNQPEGQNNYRKAVVDAECRKKWQEIVIAHGYDIETEPDKTRQLPHLSGKAWSDYQTAMDDIAERAIQVKNREVDVKLKEKSLNGRERALKALEADLKAQAEEISMKQENVSKLASEAIELYQQAQDYYGKEQKWASDEAKAHLRESRKEAENQKKKARHLQVQDDYELSENHDYGYSYDFGHPDDEEECIP